MDWDRVDMLKEQTDWLIENIDLEEYVNSTSIPVTLNGVTRNIDTKVFDWVDNILRKSMGGSYGHKDVFQYLSEVLFDDYSGPGGMTYGQTGTWNYLKSYTLDVKDNTVTLDIVWGVTIGPELKDHSKQEHCDDIIMSRVLHNPTKQQRLQAFSVVRGYVKLLFGNHYGMKDYNFKCMASENKHEFKFYEEPVCPEKQAT